MILKEAEQHRARSAMERAGQDAENTMAFYLRRGFGDAADVHVINSLRLERGEDAAQIDHLILHRGGLVIVESKSVATEVRINEHGEWTRRTDDGWTGMASPIRQAQLQADFLAKVLADNADVCRTEPAGLLGRLLGRSGTEAPDVRIVVAVSDRGIIERPSNDPMPEVRKADAVVEYVRELMEAQTERGPRFATGVLRPLADRLVGLHRPREECTREAETEGKAARADGRGRARAERPERAAGAAAPESEVRGAGEGARGRKRLPFAVWNVSGATPRFVRGFRRIEDGIDWIGRQDDVRDLRIIDDARKVLFDPSAGLTREGRDAASPDAGPRRPREIPREMAELVDRLVAAPAPEPARPPHAEDPARDPIAGYVQARKSSAELWAGMMKTLGVRPKDDAARQAQARKEAARLPAYPEYRAAVAAKDRAVLALEEAGGVAADLLKAAGISEASYAADLRGARGRLDRTRTVPAREAAGGSGEDTGRDGNAAAPAVGARRRRGRGARGGDGRD